ncbi:uncharacterized protein LOC111327810 isoform X2 [Stylophora pistillata]|uniref:uncharacterized protein LOC111327810 isoform X2 n=1 Tax=Stylophora pistillata TaxID=50429 RepID=UPI000C04A441|nr:uncharacterized protein LOC111327810 isoform X2 [Stylophora pistillata]
MQGSFPLKYSRSGSADTRVDEVLEMRLFDPNFRASNKEMHKQLKEANLTGRGYEKEVITKIAEVEGGKKEYQKIHRFYKHVICQKAWEVEKELSRLFPAMVREDMVKQFKKDVKYRRLTNMPMCKVGLEIHFPGDLSYSDDGQKAVSKRDAASSYGCCFCISINFTLNITFG